MNKEQNDLGVASSEQEFERPIIAVELFDGKYHAQFTIGNQTFKLRPLYMGQLKGPGKKDANWQADMLRIAFSLPKP